MINSSIAARERYLNQMAHIWNQMPEQDWEDAGRLGVLANLILRETPDPIRKRFSHGLSVNIFSQREVVWPRRS